MCRQSISRPGKSKRFQRGYTLVELTLVVLVLGIMAAAVIPALTPADSGKLHVAANEVADAMRFARSEAMRLHQPIGFRFFVTQKEIQVYRPDTSSVPWTAVYDIYHPVSKKKYKFKLDEQLFAATDSASIVRNYRGICRTPAKIYFDANGTARCLDPSTTLLDEYVVTLSTGDHTRVVSLDPITGRVTIQ